VPERGEDSLIDGRGIEVWGTCVRVCEHREPARVGERCPVVAASAIPNPEPRNLSVRGPAHEGVIERRNLRRRREMGMAERKDKTPTALKSGVVSMGEAAAGWGGAGRVVIAARASTAGRMPRPGPVHAGAGAFSWRAS
jgi:hypothetical protein